ncbi:MAG: 4Fe-4S binding protein, partial [Archaeoglobaceae archaeon]|nr:4Fe-4S binding protein [Archaeoglobaceae archaeon]MDW8128717.1 4Fe-4S binding protein [Archaeoglobaceae archaeon]
TLFRSDRKRVYFNEKFCIYCGACENACPYDLILVERKNYFTKEMLFNAPWRNAWEDAVDRIVRKERVKEPLKISAFGTEDMKMEEKIEIGEKPTLKGVEKLVSIEELLRKVRYRKALETGDLDVFMRGVERARGEDKRSGEQET